LLISKILEDGEKGFETSQLGKRRVQLSWTGLMNNVHVTCDNTLWYQMHCACDATFLSREGGRDQPRVFLDNSPSSPATTCLADYFIHLTCRHRWQPNPAA
jgi:hypothetical protein